MWRAAALKWCYTPTRVLSFCVISCGSALAHCGEEAIGLALTARRGWWRAVALFTKATRSTEAELLVEQVVGLLVGETTGLHLALRHAVAGLDRRPVWRRTVRVSWRHDTLGVCLCGSSPGGTQRYRGGCGGARVIITLRQSALYILEGLG